MGNGLRIAIVATALSQLSLIQAEAAEYSDQVDRIPFRHCYSLVYELRCPMVIAALAIEPDQSERIEKTIREIENAGKESARLRKAQTPEQEKAELAALIAELKIVAVKDDIHFDKLSDEERAFYWLDNSMRKASQDFERQLEKVLRPDQMSRLQEIVRRANGPEIFAKSDRAPFELTVEQKLKIDILLERYRAASRKLREVYGDHVNDFVEDERTTYTREHHRKLRAEERRTLRDILELLTPRQKEVFDQLRGEDFDLDRFDEEDEAEFRNRPTSK